MVLTPTNIGELTDAEIDNPLLFNSGALFFAEEYGLILINQSIAIQKNTLTFKSIRAENVLMLLTNYSFMIKKRKKSFAS
jgi:hypothetical protein